MNDEFPLIDLKFGLSQLSGNRELLIKLLIKFRDQYCDLPEKLIIMINANDRESARLLIHTLKGVSGNLGLKRLHSSAREAELVITNIPPNSTKLDEFNAILSETISEITALSEEQDGQEVNKNEPLEGLRDVLTRNKYISAENLNATLEQTEFSDSLKAQITQAVEELDYPTALSLIDTN